MDTPPRICVVLCASGRYPDRTIEVIAWGFDKAACDRWVEEWKKKRPGNDDYLTVEEVEHIDDLRD